MVNERIVSVGFLTQNDLDRLGATFERHFEIVEDGLFTDILAQLDDVAATPLGSGVVIMPKLKQ